MVCPRVCDNHHYNPEEEERLTTMITNIGELAQGEGCHHDTMTGSTAMVTTMKDRLQERSSEKRPMTSSDYIIRLTDRLLRLGVKISSCFSHGSRAGTTTRRDMTTTRVAAPPCNGTDYNNLRCLYNSYINYRFRYRIYHFSRYRPTRHHYIPCS